MHEAMVPVARIIVRENVCPGAEVTGERYAAILDNQMPVSLVETDLCELRCVRCADLPQVRTEGP